jgi:predicted phosphate transport protein (TIGR00153 family)
MRSIVDLFSHSPFAPMQAHIELVAKCLNATGDMFAVLRESDLDALSEMANKISAIEHQADLAKNEIRNNLPHRLFMPINRGNLLQILHAQDSIADAAEDFAVLLTLTKLDLDEELWELVRAFVAKNIETFDKIRKVVQELDELQATSFGGAEAEKVSLMIDDVAFTEHEVDILQRQLLRAFYARMDAFKPPIFQLWLQIIEAVAKISDESEKLGKSLHMTLDLK